MKEIVLTQGKVAFVDDEDFDFLNQFSWCVDKYKRGLYACSRIEINGEKKKVRMHRFILNLTDSKEFVDHIDQNGLNNQRNNLRKCSNSENLRNQSSYKKSRSRFKGVYWSNHANKWRAQILVKSKHKHLGYFLNQEDAAICYNKACLLHHKEFANLNII